MAHYPLATQNLSLVGVCVKRIGKQETHRRSCQHLSTSANVRSDAGRSPSLFVDRHSRLGIAVFVYNGYTVERLPSIGPGIYENGNNNLARRLV